MMGYLSIAWLLGATLLLPVCISHGSHTTVTSTTRRNTEQPRKTDSNVTLNFLRRFTCFSHCQDIHSCLPEHLASAVSKGDDGSVRVSSLLVDHVLQMRSYCQRANTLPCDFDAKKCTRLGYPATDGDVSFNELESVFNYALLHLKPFYQPVLQEKCFTAYDLLHDVNDAATSDEQKVDAFKTAMFARLSAGECIETIQSTEINKNPSTEFIRITSTEFINEIFEKYNNNGSNLTKSGLDQLMNAIGIVHHIHDDHDHSDDEHDHDHSDDDHDHHEHSHLPEQNSNKFSYSTSIKSAKNTQVDVNFESIQKTQPFPNTENHMHTHPHHHKRSISEGTASNYSSLNISNCLDARQLLYNFDMDGTNDISRDEFAALCPALIQQRLHGNCIEKYFTKGINTAEIYGYGTLSVFIISLCSVLGVILMPIQNSSFYEYLMMCFIALAFGTLTGDAILHLIPEAVGIHDHSEGDHHHHDDDGGLPSYFWKLFVLLASIYGLFVFEGIAALAVNGIHGQGEKSGGHGHSHVPSIDLVQMTRKNKSVSSETLESRVTTSGSMNGDVPATGHHASVSTEKPLMCCGMTTLALVIIIGDAIHNVADGLTIGAAFSSDIKGGVSSALAIFFHELPHEFGDFVILLSCGFTFKKALIWNFIASLTAFIGLYVGIEVGENEEARSWILTVAAGMFLYIALGDMLPELKNQKAKNGLIAFLVQNLGVICGMTFMILMSVYEDQIKV